MATTRPSRSVASSVTGAPPRKSATACQAAASAASADAPGGARERGRQPRRAEQRRALVARLGEAVGEQREGVAGLEDETVLGELEIGAHAEHAAPRRELAQAAGAEDEQRVVAAVGHHELPVGRRVDRVGERQKRRRRLAGQVARQAVVDLGEDVAGACARRGPPRG